MLLVQFLVLVFTCVAWWLARRDLASRPAPPLPAAPPADMRELEQLCATLEALVTDLTRRLEAVERQKLEQRTDTQPVAPSRGLLPGAGAVPGSESMPAALSLHSSPALSVPGAAPAPEPQAEPENASHAVLYALLAEGVTDPAEIARRTSLGQGEVDLLLSLRARRAL